MDYNFIVIEGNIGAGKTSLAKKISKEFNARLILEQFADNPFLPKFYKDPDRYAFPLEMSFLANRYNQLKKKLSDRDLFHAMTITDYYFSKSLIFAGETLPEDEYNLYRQIFYFIYESLPKPDLYVYLHLDVPLLLQNIKKRGRDFEQDISASYLEKLQKAYFSYLKQLRDTRIIMIDTNNMDFINSPEDYLTIKTILFHKKYPVGITRVVPGDNF